MFNKSSIFQLVALLATFANFVLADDGDTGYWNAYLICVAIVLIFVGLLFVSYGYRLFRIVVILTGFFLFGGATYLILYYALGEFHWWIILIALVVGLLGGVLLHFLYIVAIFCLGFLLGFVLSTVTWGGYLADWIYGDAIPTYFQVITWVVIVLAAVLGGVLAIKFQKFLIVLATSVVGGYGIIAGADYLIGDGRFAASLSSIFSGIPVSYYTYPWGGMWMSYLMFVAWALVSVIGVIIQLRVTGKHHDHKHIIVIGGSKKAYHDEFV
jgi:hypothetical protein